MPLTKHSLTKPTPSSHFLNEPRHGTRSRRNYVDRHPARSSEIPGINKEQDAIFSHQIPAEPEACFMKMNHLNEINLHVVYVTASPHTKLVTKARTTGFPRLPH